MIQNLVFDVGRVLLDYQPQKFLRQMVEAEDARAAVYEHVFQSPEWLLADAGKAADEDLILAAVARSPQYEKEIRHAVAVWHTGLERVEGMTQLVKAVHQKGYPLYIISNFSQRFHQLDAYEDLFSLMKGILISSDVQMVKPDAEIYRLFLSRYKLRADECLFIDDMPANVEGARLAGMRAQRFTDAGTLGAYFKSQGIL